MVEPPPGGPIDTTPPHLVSMTPDSGAVGVGELSKFTFTFSEKMDRQSATAWLYFFPDQRIKGTKWKGAITAEVELEEPLPPDTLVVVEVAGRMSDAHKVTNRRARRFPIATGTDIPAGSIAGVLVMGDSAVSTGVVEIYEVPPDSLEYYQTPLVRRTSTRADGSYVFSWLPVPGGPWLLRAFTDANGDLRPAENESKRLLPDTLSLTPEKSTLAAGVTTLYPVDTPGRLHIAPFANFGPARPIMGWSMSSGQVDTGFALQPVDPNRYPYAFVEPDTTSVLQEARPGLNRVGLFLDLDADSTYGAVPESLLLADARDFVWILADSSADTSGWYLEPIVVVPTPYLEPGLDARVDVPDTVALVMPWPAPPPPPAPADTAATDTLDALPFELPPEDE